ncbi:MAG: glycosyltransferase involved in cell wall biosynthesis [Flavobacteriaceae bacterium]|jgi:glycosyltransferase involved in cell wall biosynthesis
MKVLIVSTSDLSGGAARAAYRLHQALVRQKIDCQMLVQSKSSDDYRVLGPTTKFSKGLGKIRPFLDSLLVRFYKRRSKTLFSSSYLPFSGIIERINSINPDIVHLHWIAGGIMRIEDLAKIKAPIVWSMHDMWAFTGGCHYNEQCDAYQNGCGSCVVLGSNSKFDLSKINFLRKHNTYKKIKNLYINGSSKWISESAKSSSLFKNRNVTTIPNPIDMNLFKPVDKTSSRNLFNIPLEKKIILFGAINPLGDSRKGFKELFESLSKLELENVEFVIAGSSEPLQENSFAYPVHYIPPLSDEYSLSILYNIADVIVAPSLQENLANSIVESLLCGVPVVAFNIGGNPDLIEHKENGYLVKPFSSDDMAYGIEWVLNNKNYSTLSSNARKKAVSCYSYEVLSPIYIELYENVIGGVKS